MKFCVLKGSNQRTVSFQKVIGDVMLQIRTEKLLPPFIANISEDETCSKGPVPKYNYVPNYTGYVLRPLALFSPKFMTYSLCSLKLN